MSKNITISEGTQAKNFNNVNKIRTNVIGGGTQNWIPEDEAGRYANLEELYANENGTYFASQEGCDGFSQVTVNVSGGGDARLITKEITRNGTFNAIDDDADGFSSVVVNVAFPHGTSILNGMGATSVSQRLTTKDFFEDFDDKFFFAIEPYITSASRKAELEQTIRYGRWLNDATIKPMLDYNNLAIFANGGINGNTVVWYWYIFGIIDNSGTITVPTVTNDSITIIIDDDRKFYSATSLDFNSIQNDGHSGLATFAQGSGALNAINSNWPWGTSGTVNTITVARRNPWRTLIDQPCTGFMTNIIG